MNTQHHKILLIGLGVVALIALLWYAWQHRAVAAAPPTSTPAYSASSLSSPSLPTLDWSGLAGLLQPYTPPAGNFPLFGFVAKSGGGFYQ